MEDAPPMVSVTTFSDLLFKNFEKTNNYIDGHWIHADTMQ
jgi:hypothetical protein